VVESSISFATLPSCREKIWDHCAGFVIVEEAGGCVTDAGGKRLDFSQGRYLKLDRCVAISAKVPDLRHCFVLMHVCKRTGTSELKLVVEIELQWSIRVHAMVLTHKSRGWATEEYQ
jgi:hypothetical protein